MTLPRAYIVVNPVAGTVHPQAIRPAVERHLGSPWAFDLHVTAIDDDVSALVRKQVEAGVDVVMAVGGDGTVRQVAAGMVGSEATLAILPGGTGNVVARDTGVPLDLEAALALVAGPHRILPLDAIQVGDTYAFLNLSMGVSVGIVRDADAEQKKRFGHLAYIWSGVRNLTSTHLQDVALAIDGQTHFLRASEIFVANCPSLGIPEFRVAVEILPSDGKLQVIAFRARTLGDYVHLMQDLLMRRHHLHHHVRIFTAEHEISIETQEPLDVQGDGDLIGQTPLTALVIPGAVRLAVPEHA